MKRNVTENGNTRKTKERPRKEMYEDSYTKRLGKGRHRIGWEDAVNVKR